MDETGMLCPLALSNSFFYRASPIKSIRSDPCHEWATLLDIVPIPFLFFLFNAFIYFEAPLFSIFHERASRSFAIFSNEYLEPQDAASLSILISLAADGNDNGNIIDNSGLGMMAAWEASVRSLINQSRNNSSTAHAT